jgi:hypothetical protein
MICLGWEPDSSAEWGLDGMEMICDDEIKK